ncbi:MAG TPA: carbon-nitrogen hydrolase family protein [Candidatus Hydrogenedentes bacterium]|nr:carbon-nitrogen hydrolase family protein [Candidatus Hydrogenedentota bacterium]HPG65711.1 carbon-nitrogen hydrolase family protein [Candidatus Hydrogenedentota bacterium]
MVAQAPQTPSGDPSSIRVALCQVYTEPWAVDENGARTLEALDAAADQGAQLAITPECVFHGYAFEGVNNYAIAMRDIAETLAGPRLQSVCRKARQRRLDVIVGFAESGGGRNIHNSAALISSAGEIVGVYRKVHCRRFEQWGQGGVFVPGHAFHVRRLEYDGVACSVGTMICFDREVPETVRCLRSLGAQLIACPLATDTHDLVKPGKRMDNEQITRCRAAENEVFIAVVNHSGRFNGGSFVVGPSGEVLHQMGADAGVAVIDVPVGIVGKQFHSDPWGWMGWGYRRPEIYGHYLK